MLVCVCVCVCLCARVRECARAIDCAPGSPSRGPAGLPIAIHFPSSQTYHSVFGFLDEKKAKPGKRHGDQ